MTTQLHDDPNERLHALDAVRALALLLGVVLHATVSFLPEMKASGFPVADESSSSALAVIYHVIHLFRLTTFFLIAGFFARLLYHRQGLGSFLRNRSKRIVLPLLVGWPICAVAIGAVYLWAVHKSPASAPPSGDAGDDGQLPFSLMHLWFLYYLIWMYALVLSARLVWTWIDSGERARRAIDRGLRWIASHQLVAPALGLPMAIPLYFLEDWQVFRGVPTPNESLIPQSASFVAYGSAFALGWLLQRQPDLLRLWEQRWRLHLASAVALTLLSLMLCSPYFEQPWSFTLEGGQKAGYALVHGMAAWASTIAVVAVCMRFLAEESPARRYVADASYWIYLVHLPLVLGMQAALMDVGLHWSVKFTAILAVSSCVLLVTYHYAVRPTFIGAVLNGRRYPRSRVPSPRSAKHSLSAAG